MKLRYLYSMVVSSLLVVSCNNEILLEGQDNDLSANAIKIASVEQNGFESDQTTRSSYVGYATKFENGDKLGLVLVDKEGKQLANAPFAYTESKWNNVNNQPYSSKIGKVIAYFPYNESLSKDVASLDDLKNSIEINPVQSSLDDFKKMDLLVCELNKPSFNLNIVFKHAFSMIALSAKSTIQGEGETFNYSIEMENVALSIGEETYTPCSMNGTYVCLVEPQSQLQANEFRYFYTMSGETSVKTVTNSITTSAGTRYTFPCAIPNSGGEESLSIGDFYCISNSSNNTVIVPGNAAALPEGLTCKGIVFHVMDDAAFTAYKSTNELTEELTGYKGSHGLFISTKDGQVFGMDAVPATVNVLINSVFNASLTDCNKTDVSNGYKLTKALQQAAAVEGSTITFTALDNHADNVQNATPWYAPSFNELKYLIQGADTQPGSILGQIYINKQLSKIKGKELAVTIPSINFKYDGEGLNGFRLMTNGGEDGWHGIPGQVFRPICAF